MTPIMIRSKTSSEPEQSILFTGRYDDDDGDWCFTATFVFTGRYGAITPRM